MKTLYLECNMGAAGDMLTAALLELYGKPEVFLEWMNQLGLEGVQVSKETVSRCGICGTHVTVTVHGEEEISDDGHHHDTEHEHENHHHDTEHEHENHHHDTEHEHENHHHNMEHEHHHNIEHEHGNHHHASLEHIHKLIRGLRMPEAVKKDACAIYDLIAKAESHAHNRPVEEIHFHEVGTMDAVADIIGCCYLMHELAPEKVVVSPVNVGYGQVHCAHGILPVPAPATAYLLQNAPTYAGTIAGEMCTPTGAALLQYFATEYGKQPVMCVEKTGYGMGRKEFAQANCVRAFWGTEADRDSTKADVQSSLTYKGRLLELSCNLDDMTGEALAYAAGLLRGQGALEVFVCPIQMKKNRSGQMLVCLCREEDADALAVTMLRETTTFGVRRKTYERYVLERNFSKIDTCYGEITVKTGTGYGIRKSKPEYDEVAAAAEKHGVTIAQVMHEVEKKLP